MPLVEQQLWIPSSCNVWFRLRRCVKLSGSVVAQRYQIKGWLALVEKCTVCSGLTKDSAAMNQLGYSWYLLQKNLHVRIRSALNLWWFLIALSVDLTTKCWPDLSGLVCSWHREKETHGLSWYDYKSWYSVWAQSRVFLAQLIFNGIKWRLVFFFLVMYKLLCNCGPYIGQ